MLPFRRLGLGLALLSSAPMAKAAQTYCSNQNTGSDFSPVYSIYQSNGACSDSCRSEYAFAVVQYQNCWCSNYIPAQQDDVSDCSQECPGYPQELCGDASSGLYGYIQLNIEPSGTAGAAGASSTPSPPSSTRTSTTVPSSTPPSSTPPPPSSTQEQTSIVSSTVVQTVTQSVSQTVQTTQTSQTIQTSHTVQTSEKPTPRTTSTSSTSTSSSSPPPTTQSATPVTSIIQTTVSGQVVTRTVTSTPVVVSPANSDNNPTIERKQGLSGGAVAGIVIGAIVGFAALAIAAFLLWRRKKNADAAEATGAGTTSKKNMTRNVSVLSKAGLLSRGNRPEMGEGDHDDAYAAGGSNSVRHSMLFGPGAEGVSPISPLGSSHGESASSRRPSKPMVYDQRLNPSVLFSNSEANGSRISMQDTQDYSRPLGVMNPDPRPSFESRTSNYHA